MNQEKILKFLTNATTVVVLLVIVEAFFFFNSDLVSSVQNDAYPCVIEMKGANDVYVSPGTCRIFNISTAVFFIGVATVIITGLVLKKKSRTSHVV